MDAPSWLALLGLGGGLIPKYRGGDRTLIREFKSLGWCTWASVDLFSKSDWGWINPVVTYHHKPHDDEWCPALYQLKQLKSQHCDFITALHIKQVTVTSCTAMALIKDFNECFVCQLSHGYQPNEFKKLLFNQVQPPQLELSEEQRPALDEEPR